MRQPPVVSMNPTSIRCGRSLGTTSVPVEFAKRPVCLQPLRSSSMRLPLGRPGPRGNTVAAARVRTLRAARELGAVRRPATVLAAGGGVCGGSNSGDAAELPPQPEVSAAPAIPSMVRNALLGMRPSTLSAEDVHRPRGDEGQSDQRNCGLAHHQQFRRASEREGIGGAEGRGVREGGV